MLPLLILFTSLLSPVLGEGASYCSDQNVFCLNVKQEASSSSYLFTVTSTHTGWVGVGLGSVAMPYTPMVLGWLNSKGSIVNSLRMAPGYIMPQVMTDDLNQQVLLESTAPMPNGGIAFAFRIGFKDANLILDTVLEDGDQVVDFMCGMSDKVPLQRDKSGSSITRHTSVKQFQLVVPGFPKPAGVPESPSAGDSPSSTVESPTGKPTSIADTPAPVQQQPSSKSDTRSSASPTLPPRTNSSTSASFETSTTTSTLTVFGSNLTSTYAGSNASSVTSNNLFQTAVEATSVVSSQNVSSLKTATGTLTYANTRSNTTILNLAKPSATAPKETSSFSNTNVSHNNTNSSSTNPFTYSDVTTSSPFAHYCTDTSLTFCITISLGGNKANPVSYTFTVQTRYTGWAGLGIGSSMNAASAFVVGWRGTNNNIVLSQRDSSQHTQPLPSDPSKIIFTQKPAGSNLQSMTWAGPADEGIMYTFSINAQELQASPQTFIFAVSNQPPTNPDRADSVFSKHEVTGSFSVRLSDLVDRASLMNGKSAASFEGSLEIDIIQGPTTTSDRRYLVVHGVFMLLAWVILPSVAVGAARYAKETLGHKWFHIHAGLMAAGAVGILLVFAVFPVQIGLGWLSKAYFSEDNTTTTRWNGMHRWFGRVGILAGVVNVQLV
ncbi:hypothetical protein HDU80_005560 [Chytriomyces hyalinus]|nr:hypothetical protein HDU80_005560 [Chytriomyces hyalinus]